ncbi:MAG: hypothetical protein MK212_10660 [Saprospiraceae bacterium]|nr:hypothetical protein [Saprospiraceae bacterium]
MQYIYRFIFIGILCFWVQASQAQQISFTSNAYLGIANNLEAGYFYNGGGLDFTYTHEAGKGRILVGLNYRMIHWGNQVGLSAGYDFPFWQKGAWRASVASEMELAFALFFQKPLLGWTVNCVPMLEWKSKKAFFVNIGLGLQFNHNPAYANYGRINSALDIPIKIGFGFTLGNRKRTLTAD